MNILAHSSCIADPLANSPQEQTAELALLVPAAAQRQVR